MPVECCDMALESTAVGSSTLISLLADNSVTAASDPVLFGRSSVLVQGVAVLVVAVRLASTHRLRRTNGRTGGRPSPVADSIGLHGRK